MTTAEVADLCRTSPETVRYWRHIGTGPISFKVGRRVLYAAADVEQWLEAKRAEQRDPTSRLVRAQTAVVRAQASLTRPA